MSRRAFVCSDCGNLVPFPADRYERRTEYVSLDRRNRLGVIREGLVCKSCARAEIAKRRGQTVSGQGTLGLR